MDLQQLEPRRRDLAILGLGTVVGLVLGIAFTVILEYLNPGPAHVRTVDGWAFPSSDGTQIGFSRDPTGGATGYPVAGVAWAGPDAVWHVDEGGATCVGTDPTKRVKVSLDLVTVHSAAGTLKRVEAIRCRE